MLHVFMPRNPSNFDFLGILDVAWKMGCSLEDAPLKNGFSQAKREENHEGKPFCCVFSNNGNAQLQWLVG